MRLDVDGFELCRKLRRAGNYLPVIMLTARNSAEDRVKGLESGADDYLVKPFELDELLARVRSILRRRQWEREQEDASLVSEAQRATFGRVLVDFQAHEVSVDGETKSLTRLEMDLLRYFVTNPGRVLSRNELLELAGELSEVAPPPGVPQGPEYGQALQIARLDRVRSRLQGLD